MTVLIDIELNIMGFLHTSPSYRDVYATLGMSGVVEVIALVSQGYREFRVQDLYFWD